MAAPTVTWEFPERPAPDGVIAQELVKAGVLSQAELETFATRNIIWRDHIWTEAAAHIIREHRPNLMMYHLLNLDSTQHRYGPRTPAAMTTMAHLDAQVAEIVAAVERAGLTSRTTFFVVSDHGFKLVKRQIRLNAAFMKAGLLKATDGKILQSDAYVVPGGRVGDRLPDVARPGLGAAGARTEGDGRRSKASTPSSRPPTTASYGLPQPSDNNQMGVLFVTPKEGYAFTAASGRATSSSTRPKGSLGAHGYPNTDPDLSALFIASGAGIAPGVKLDRSTTSTSRRRWRRFSGVKLEKADGKVLKEILSPQR